MDIEEIKAMVGTEFTYMFEDGDTIPTVIAAFDPDIGFTCLASDTLITRDGYDFSKRVDENGNMCMVGINRDNYDTLAEFLEEVSEHTTKIAEEGFYQIEFGGQASCSF
jgi:hypothetical protein